MVVAFPRWGRLFSANQVIPQQLLQQFLDSLAEISLSPDEDTVVWSLNGSQAFSIKTCYNAINDGGLRSSYQNSVWFSVVPLKVKISSWLALKDKILTWANLIKRGWQGPVEGRIYGHHEEIVLHIFFHCAAARVIWNFMLRDVETLLHKISFNQIFSLQHHLLFQITYYGWNSLLLGIFWSLWLYRNEAIFRNHVTGKTCAGGSTADYQDLCLHFIIPFQSDLTRISHEEFIWFLLLLVNINILIT